MIRLETIYEDIGRAVCEAEGFRWESASDEAQDRLRSIAEHVVDALGLDDMVESFPKWSEHDPRHEEGRGLFWVRSADGQVRLAWLNGTTFDDAWTKLSTCTRAPLPFEPVLFAPCYSPDDFTPKHEQPLIEDWEQL
jgi:hypothetical protein